MKENTKYSGGFMALTSMIIISAIALAIAVSISLMGVTEAKSSLNVKEGERTLKVAESCVEEAMLRLKNDATYTGGSLNVGDGTCNISLVGTATDKTIVVDAHISGVSSYVKKVSAVVKLTGDAINLVSWTETP